MRRCAAVLITSLAACTSGEHADGGGTGSTGTASESGVTSTSAPSTSGDASGASNPATDSTGEAPTGGATTETTLDGTDTSDDDPTTEGPVGNGGAFEWVANDIRAHDYGHRLELPPTFGAGELSFQVWIKPDDSFPVGSTADDTLTNWSSEDNEPYGTGDWWYRGNFLLDGHNNNGGFSEGTFSLQFYGGGRVRWLFGDGSTVTGGVWSAGAYPADATPSLLDGNWHQLTLVRRWSGADEADLELWIDGALADTETSGARTDMRQYWDEWTGFGGAQDGWFWGAEKQAALGVLSQYEDYKGLMTEVRFWDVALDDIEATWADAVTGDEPGLVGHVPWNEGSGQQACDVITATCSTLYLTDDTQWIDEGPPLVR